MTDHDQNIVSEAVSGSKDRKTRWIIRVLSVLVIASILTAGIVFWNLWHQKQDQVDAGKNLATQVQAACNNGYLGGQICQTAKDVEKAPKQGPPGVKGDKGDKGDPGKNGINGTNGTNGHDGKNGKNGTNGTDGVDGKDGTDGTDGRDGVDGQDGAMGPQGEKGDKGDKGDPGESAFPFTFEFTIQGNGISPDHTYSVTCTSSTECVTTQIDNNGGPT